jgi:hypothetical protein
MLGPQKSVSQDLKMPTDDVRAGEVRISEAAINENSY